jgi:hypothetical protein
MISCYLEEACVRLILCHDLNELFLSLLNIYSLKPNFHWKGESRLMDICISCGNELSLPERNRSECWDCRDTTTEAYTEDE